MLSELTIQNFMASLAGDSPVPGGGSVAALSGAAGASLIAMVASLTVGKEGYEEVFSEMKEVKEKMDKAAGWFQSYMDEDAGSYGKVIECYKLPKDTEEEKEIRKKAIQEAMTNAALVPLVIAEKAAELFDLAKLVVEKGNKNAASDGAVAALMARACILGALYNVRINAIYIKDEELRADLLFKAELLEKKAKEEEGNVLSLLSFE